MSCGSNCVVPISVAKTTNMMAQVIAKAGMRISRTFITGWGWNHSHTTSPTSVAPETTASRAMNVDVNPSSCR